MLCGSALGSPWPRCSPFRPPPSTHGHACSARATAACRSCSALATKGAVRDAVVTTTWLHEHLQDVSILEVRGHVDTVETEPGVEQSTYIADYSHYLEGHIPGAVFVNWTKDGIDGDTSVPVQMQMDPDLFAAAMEAKGVSNDRPVVIYDAGDGMMSARLWWMLLAQGHPEPLVLEGGFARWQAEGRPTELYEPCMLKVYAQFDAQPRPQLRVTAEQLNEQLRANSDSGAGSNESNMLVLDTRSMDQYTGQVRRGPRGGHIPGAVALPRRALLDPSNGWLKPLKQQRQLLQEAGVRLPQQEHDALSQTEHQQEQGQQEEEEDQEEQRVVVYCNGGVAACTVALALHRLGHRNWAVYDGSWNEWGSRSDLPVEQ